MAGKGIWKSGELCEVAGKYCSECCGKEEQKKFVAGDIFPRCKRCDEKMKWHRCLGNVLSLDAPQLKSARR
jgi:hypothetical protein